MKAAQSPDRKFIVCGDCGRKLAGRARRERAGGPPKEIGGRRVPGTRIEQVIVWGDGWHLVDDHIEMHESAQNRLLAGYPPSRAPWGNEGRPELRAALERFAPAVCPWCGGENEIDPRRLDVDGIAVY